VTPDLEQIKQRAEGYRNYSAPFTVADDVDALLAAIDELTAQRDKVLAVVNSQAEDEGLWFVAETAPEAYLQQELRKMLAVIEGALGVEL
jgi:hypothetical protein